MRQPLCLAHIKHSMNVSCCYYYDYYYHFLWSLVLQVKGEDEALSLMEGSALERRGGTGGKKSWVRVEVVI